MPLDAYSKKKKHFLKFMQLYNSLENLHVMYQENRLYNISFLTSDDDPHDEISVSTSRIVM